MDPGIIGSKKDADDMEKVLKKLDFDVDKYVDFTLTQIRNKSQAVKVAFLYFYITLCLCPKDPVLSTLIFTQQEGMVLTLI